MRWDDLIFQCSTLTILVVRVSFSHCSTLTGGIVRVCNDFEVAREQVLISNFHTVQLSQGLTSLLQFSTLVVTPQGFCLELQLTTLFYGATDLCESMIK